MSTFISTQRDFPSILLGRVAALEKDPGDLDAAVKAGAFDGLRIAVRDLGATGTIATIAASGLRGRGGAGFPTGEKWRAAASRPAGQRYVVANGYGADPGTHTDAALLAADPYLVLEGLAIAAFAIGATEAILAVRADDPALVTTLEGAALAAEEAGFLGDNVLNSGQRVTVRSAPSRARSCWARRPSCSRRSRASAASPSRSRPTPPSVACSASPPSSTTSRRWPAVPWIVREGGPAFAATGVEDSPGTVLVAAPRAGGRRDRRGAVRHAVPHRSSNLAGGRGDRALKAILVGGPDGRHPARRARIDMPYAYGPLREAGAHVGSGSVVFADDRACVVDLARLLTRFSADEACGKTIPCRIGLAAAVRDRRPHLDGPSQAHATPTSWATSRTTSRPAALCDHERLATLAFTSGMRYFRSEIDDHILRSSCPAGVCQPIAVARGRGELGPRHGRPDHPPRTPARAPCPVAPRQPRGPGHGHAPERRRWPSG